MANQKETNKINEHWYDRVIRILLYAMIVGMPVFFSIAFYSPFAAAKLLLLRSITFLILFLWGLKIFLEKKIVFRTSKIYIPLGIFALSLFLSTVFSMNIYTSLFGMETRYLGLFTWLNFLIIIVLFHQFITNKKQIKTVLNLGFTTAVLLAIFGIMQFFGKVDFGIQWSQNAQERVFGTIGHSNHFGAYLGMFFVVGIPLLIESFQKKLYYKMAATAVSMLILSATIALTGSRGALFATIIASVIVGIVLFSKKIINKKSSTLASKIVLAMATGFLIILIIAGQAGVFKRIENSFHDLQQGYLPDRLSWWQSGFSMFKDRPLLGFGVSTFSDFYNQYRRTDYLVPADLQDQISPESSHNDYVDLLVNQGIFGLLSYVFLIGLILFPLLKQVRTPKNIDEKMIICTALLGGIFTYLIQVFVNFGVVDTLSIYFILLGLSVSAASPAINSKNIKTISFDHKTKNINFLIGLTSTLVISIFITSGIIFTYRDAAADMAYAQGYRASFTDIDEAQKYFYEATNLQPFRYEYYQNAGIALLGAARDGNTSTPMQLLNQAAAEYKNALYLNKEHPSVWYQSALVYFEIAKSTKNPADLQQALLSLKMAVAKSPNNPIYLYQTAKVYLDLGEKTIAKNLFEQVQKIRPNYQDTAAQLAVLK